MHRLTAAAGKTAWYEYLAHCRTVEWKNNYSVQAGRAGWQTRDHKPVAGRCYANEDGVGTGGFWLPLGQVSRITSRFLWVLSVVLGF
jgi:hypothetical protein